MNPPVTLAMQRGRATLPGAVLALLLSPLFLLCGSHQLASQVDDEPLRGSARPAGGESQAGVQIGSASARHRGRAGIYYRASKRDRGGNYDNPLINAVVITTSWADVEPERGRFDLSSLRETVDRWGKAGKGVVLNVMLYGQSPDDSITPSWVYRAGTSAISFQGGGRSKGNTVRIPRVWADDFVANRFAPLVAALAREFDGDPTVWYVMPAFGHIGNINAQPSKGGGVALREAGWTPQKWARYVTAVVDLHQREFKKTPLLSKSAPMLLKDRRMGNYGEQADEILVSIARSGVAVISLGISGNLADARAVHARLSPVATLAQDGATRIGMGDDWPLWVPESRRGSGPNAGYDDANLERIRRLVFGGTEGLPETPVTILFAQEPEMSASNPNNPAYRQEIHDIVRAFRDGLLANDRRIYGLD